MSGFFAPTPASGIRPWTAPDVHGVTWSPPQMIIMASADAGDLESIVDDFLAQPDLQVLAISPATLVMNPLVKGHMWTVTAVYQSRDVGYEQGGGE